MNIHPVPRFLIRLGLALLYANSVHVFLQPSTYWWGSLASWWCAVWMLYGWKTCDNWVSGLRKVNVISEEVSSHE